MADEVVESTDEAEKMQDDGENEDAIVVSEEPCQTGIEIIGLDASDAADSLPLEEKWWSAAPATPLEPLTPDQLFALICNDSESGGGKDEVDIGTPAVIRAAVHTLLTQPYDMEAWARLVDESKASKWRRREILFAATRQFPTSGKCWVDYIGYELTRLEPDVSKIDKYWSEAMGISGHSNLDLWMLHLQRSLEKYEDSCSDRDHAVAEHRQADIEVLDRARRARNVVVDNFEKCLKRVGFDYGAGGLWMRYADFVRSWPCGPEAGATEKQDRTKLLRSIYQRACALPLRKVPELWKQYEHFETREVVNNETLAGKLLDEHRSYFKTAAATARERSVVWDSPEQINNLTSKFPSPPLSAHAFSDRATKSIETMGAVTTTAEDYAEDPLQVFPCRNIPPNYRSRRTLEQDNLVLVWRRRCQYEASNKQKLPYEEARKRAVHTFEQCLSVMRFYPECWYQYAQYELNLHREEFDQPGDKEERSVSSCARRAGAIYRRALVALPGCTLLYVAYAECMESVGELDSARAALVSLVKVSPSSGVAWALLQKFIRKTDGVQAARMLFKLTKKARESDELGYVIYLAHAILEWHTNESPSVALRVFEYAAGRHPHFLACPEFALAYAECTMVAPSSSSNSDSEQSQRVRDCRSIFERCITAMAIVLKYHQDAKAEKVTYNAEKENDREWRGIIDEPGPMPVWFAFMKFEALHGSNVAGGKRLLELEKRMVEFLPASDIASLDLSSFTSCSPLQPMLSKPIYLPSASVDVLMASKSIPVKNLGKSRKGIVTQDSTSPPVVMKEEVQLQRLWWRHISPGIDPLSCATQTDASFYARCFRGSVTSKETSLANKSSWLSRALTFTPITADKAPSATIVANMLNSASGPPPPSTTTTLASTLEEPAWLKQATLNEAATPIHNQSHVNQLSSMADSSSSLVPSSHPSAPPGQAMPLSNQEGIPLPLGQPAPPSQPRGTLPLIEEDQVVGDGKVDIPPFLKQLFLSLPQALPGQKPDVKYIISGLLTNPMLAAQPPQNAIPQNGMNKRDRTDEDDVFRMRQRAKIE